MYYRLVQYKLPVGSQEDFPVSGFSLPGNDTVVAVIDSWGEGNSRYIIVLVGSP